MERKGKATNEDVESELAAQVAKMKEEQKQKQEKNKWQKEKNDKEGIKGTDSNIDVDREGGEQVDTDEEEESLMTEHAKKVAAKLKEQRRREVKEATLAQEKTKKLKYNKDCSEKMRNADTWESQTSEAPGREGEDATARAE